MALVRLRLKVDEWMNACLDGSCYNDSIDPQVMTHSALKIEHVKVEMTLESLRCMYPSSVTLNPFPVYFTLLISAVIVAYQTALMNGG